MGWVLQSCHDVPIDGPHTDNDIFVINDGEVYPIHRHNYVLTPQSSEIWLDIVSNCIDCIGFYRNEEGNSNIVIEVLPGLYEYTNKVDIIDGKEVHKYVDNLDSFEKYTFNSPKWGKYTGYKQQLHVKVMDLSKAEDIGVYLTAGRACNRSRATFNIKYRP